MSPPLQSLLQAIVGSNRCGVRFARRRNFAKRSGFPPATVQRPSGPRHILACLCLGNIWLKFPPEIQSIPCSSRCFPSQRRSRPTMDFPKILWAIRPPWSRRAFCKSMPPGRSWLSPALVPSIAATAFVAFILMTKSPRAKKTGNPLLRRSNKTPPLMK